ncbi:unnamed protein product, partial [Mesorhabditis belari]|uniref:Sulfotransferase n=1 Tax=Mesorhabditis belari TaxID=2138241 RepID=A0AAF3F936_9BILA
MRIFALILLVQLLESTRFRNLPTLQGSVQSLVDTHFGLQYCKIPKTGSTITRTILCDIFREYRGMNFTQEFTDNQTGENACVANAWFPDDGETIWKKPRRVTKFTLVRDPVDRFVSLYGHFCGILKRCGDR